MRLVLDTCIFVAAFRSRNGRNRELIHQFVAGRFELVATPSLFLEYEDILTRDIQIRAHGYTAYEIGTFMSDLAKLTILIPRISFQVKPQLRDPNDELVLEAAVNGCAEAIVTFNLRDFLPAAHDFGIHVLRPGSIIDARLRS